MKKGGMTEEEVREYCKKKAEWSSLTRTFFEAIDKGNNWGLYIGMTPDELDEEIYFLADQCRKLDDLQRNSPFFMGYYE